MIFISFVLFATAATTIVGSWIHLNSIKQTKVLINKRCGGFRYSAEFEKEFLNTYNYSVYSIPQNTESRYDPRILNVFEKLGEKKSSFYLSSIMIKNIPEQLLPHMYISEKYGAETIHIRMGNLYKELLQRILNNRAIRYFDTIDYEFLENMEKNLTSSGIICE